MVLGLEPGQTHCYTCQGWRLQATLRARGKGWNSRIHSCWCSAAVMCGVVAAGHTDCIDRSRGLGTVGFVVQDSHLDLAIPDHTGSVHSRPRFHTQEVATVQAKRRGSSPAVGCTHFRSPQQWIEGCDEVACLRRCHFGSPGSSRSLLLLGCAAPETVRDLETFEWHHWRLRLPWTSR